VLRRISGQVRGNAVAYVALFVALGGTAAASAKLAANSVGTAQLKNRAVTGKKVARSTLTGANIKASTLGTVPQATNAANAQNATSLGGQPRTSFQSRVNGTCPSGRAITSIAAAGTVGCASTNVTQLMGGIQQLSPAPTTKYLAAEGLTPVPAPTTETDGIGASTVGGTAAHLDVGIFAVQPTSLTFTLDVNDAPTAVTCTIPAGGTTCEDATDTAPVPAGALVDIAVTGGAGPATQMVFGWTDTTPG
jgi:hypothetical protein